MGKVILGVTVSLDGFAEDSDGSIGSLYADLETLRTTAYFQESIATTGAVVMAWKEFAMAPDPDFYAGDYEYQVPIFVTADRPPQKHPRETDELTFTFITDGFGSAIRQARIAAGDRDVNIIGSAETTRQCLATGLVDELQVDIVPRFLLAGFRPFENLEIESLKLDRIKVMALEGGRTHLRFRVLT